MLANKKITMGLIVLMLCSSSFAAVYKWTDSQGKVHYSSQPGSHNATQVDVAPPPPKNTAIETRNRAYQKRDQQQKLEQEQAAQEAATAEKAKSLQQQIEIACKRYRENLALLGGKGGGQRLYTVKPDGEYHYLSDEERQQQIDSTQKLIEKHCE